MPENRPTITYQEFISSPGEIPEGTIVTGINPRKLLTTQTWFDPEKVKRALNTFQNGVCTEPIQTRVISDSGKRALVIGDGNHRTGLAFYEGIPITAEIKHGEPSNSGRMYRFSQVVRNYADLLRIE